FVARQVHAEDRVVVVRGELGPGCVDQLLQELFDVDAARADLFHADAFAQIAGLGLPGCMRFGTGSHDNAPSSNEADPWIRTGIRRDGRSGTAVRQPSGSGHTRYFSRNLAHAWPHKMCAGV